MNNFVRSSQSKRVSTEKSHFRWQQNLYTFAAAIEIGFNVSNKLLAFYWISPNSYSENFEIFELLADNGLPLEEVDAPIALEN